MQTLSIAPLVVLAALTVVSVAGCEPLLSSVGEGGVVGFGGASSSSAGDEEEEEEDKDLVGALLPEQTVAECVLGDWEVDPVAYAQLLASASGGALSADAIEMSGSASISFTPDTITATYSAWEARVQAPEGIMIQVTDGVESAGWTIDESDVITTAAPTSVANTTLFVELNGQRMAMPMGDAPENQLAGESFLATCTDTSLELDGTGGFLLLTR